MCTERWGADAHPGDLFAGVPNYRSDEPNLWSAELIRDYAGRLRPGCWVFVGPVSASTWNFDQYEAGTSEWKFGPQRANSKSLVGRCRDRPTVTLVTLACVSCFFLIFPVFLLAFLFIIIFSLLFLLVQNDLKNQQKKRKTNNEKHQKINPKKNENLDPERSHSALQASYLFLQWCVPLFDGSFVLHRLVRWLPVGRKRSTLRSSQTEKQVIKYHWTTDSL